MFAAERLARRSLGAVRPSAAQEDGAVPPLPEVPRWLEKVLMKLAALDMKMLRKHDLPFGSSVIIAATKL